MSSTAQNRAKKRTSRLRAGKTGGISSAWIFLLVFLLIPTCTHTGGALTDSALLRCAKLSGDIYDLESYLRKFPEGKHVKEAREAISRKLPQKEPWQSVALALMDLDDIDGAAFDPDDGQLRIWGEAAKRLPPFILDDLVVALKVISRGEDIGVSIDPPQKSEGELSPDTLLESAVVYIPSYIKNTHMGSVLYEIDRKLKSLSNGKDNLTGEVVSSDVPGFQTLIERAKESHSVGWKEGHFSRLWFKPDPPEMLTEGYAVRFGKIKMILKPESQHRLVQEFATHMTDYFDQFARNDVVFAELVRLHKVIALARWLQDGGFPVDDFIENYPLIKMKTPQKTTARFIPIKTLERTDEKEVGRYKHVYKHEHMFGVAGGVHFPRYNNNYMIPKKQVSKVETKSDIPLPSSAFSSSLYGPPRYGYTDPDRSLPPYYKRMNNARPTKKAWSWNVDLQGNQYKVIAIPMTFTKSVAMRFEGY